MTRNGTHLLAVTWEGQALVHRCLQCGEKAPPPTVVDTKVPWENWDTWLDTCPGTKPPAGNSSCA